MDNYNALAAALEKQIKEKGLEERLTVTGYNFRALVNDHGHFNPYVGLLQEADHVIVCGDSRSLISEPLAAGKPVMLYEAGKDHIGMKQKGLALEFNTCAAHRAFETGKIKPVNLTEDIADKMAQEFRKKAFWHKMNPTTWVKKAFKP